MDLFGDRIRTTGPLRIRPLKVWRRGIMGYWSGCHSLPNAAQAIRKRQHRLVRPAAVDESIFIDADDHAFLTSASMFQPIPFHSFTAEITSVISSSAITGEIGSDMISS